MNNKISGILLFILGVLAAVMTQFICTKQQPKPPTPVIVVTGGKGSVPATMTFGVAPMCAGKGICQPSATGIPVAFTPIDANAMVLNFFWNVLNGAEPGEGPLFTNGGSYVFQCPYMLSNNPIFAPFNLAPGAIISTNSFSRVSIDPTGQQLVSDTIGILYSAPVTLNVVFGVQGTGGGCDQTGSGICSFAAGAPPPPPAATVPVTFSLQMGNDFIPGNARVIQLSFDINALNLAEPRQVPLFNAGTYTFANPFTLTDGAFASLQLPPNARIPNTPGAVSISGTTVTFSIQYTF
jgi:hypothetical protein